MTATTLATTYATATKMFAAHDQENLVSIHQTVANGKQHGTTRGLQPKTPGARYPKTPLKVPLNDENAARGLGGKSILNNKTRTDRSQWVTPAGERIPFWTALDTTSKAHHMYPPQTASMFTHKTRTEPRTGRAVLGDKTTNAKTRGTQTVNGKSAVVRDVEKSQARPPTASRPKSQAPKTESSKLHILLDQLDPLSDEVDTNPSPPPALPYESDVFPEGVLTFDALRPENRLKGYYDYYHNRRDENGMTRVDREMKAAQEHRFREAEARIAKDLKEFEWDLGLDSPKKKIVPLKESAEEAIIRPGAAARAPPTLNSRRAASALGIAPKPSTSTLPRRPLSTKPDMPSGGMRLPSFMQPTKARQNTSSTTSNVAPRTRIPSAPLSSAAVAASRSTLGYNKGRSVSSVVHSQQVRNRPEAPARSFTRSNTAASDKTITPASYAAEIAEPKPEFVSIFDVPPEQDEQDDRLFGLVGAAADKHDGVYDDDDNDDDGLFDANEVFDLPSMSQEDEFRLELSL